MLDQPTRPEKHLPPSPPKSRSRLLDYIGRHWRGELSLARSFWINFLLVSATLATTASFTERWRPEGGAVASLASAFCQYAMLMALRAWQVVGVLRSASRAVKEGARPLWIALAALVMAGVVLLCLADLSGRIIPELVARTEIALGDPRTGPHRVRLLRDARELEFWGGLSAGTADEIRGILATTPSIRAIHLNSFGGRLGEGRALRELIRERRLTTYVSQYCASACSIAFSGGAKRSIAPNAWLGFHAVGGRGWSSLDLMEENALVMTELADTGVSPAFAMRAFSTPPDGIFKPSLDELLEAGVVTGIAGPADFALSGFAKPGSRAELRRWLAAHPGFAALERGEPAVFDAVLQELASIVERGGTLSAFERRIRHHLVPLLAKYAPVASDDAAARLGEAMLSEIFDLSARAPRACDEFVTARDKPLPDVGVYVQPDVVEQEVMALVDVIESGMDRPQKAATEREAQPVIARAVDRLRERYAEASQGLGEALSPCQSVDLLYREILPLPRPEASLALRFMLGRPGLEAPLARAIDAR